MGKRVLILVLSCDLPPYRKMIETSQETWDSFEVDGVETIYITGESKQNSGSKEVNLPIKESLHSMGEKAIQSFDYVLKNKDFDYVARVNSSCYVDKKELIKFVQTLPEKDLFAGLECDSQNGFRYNWGGGQLIVSKDVIERVVNARSLWNHRFMEDESLSLLTTKLGIPFYAGMACSINKRENDYLLLSYGKGKNIEFTDFNKVKDSGHFFYRVKFDGDRSVDEFVMKELFKTLK